MLQEFFEIDKKLLEYDSRAMELSRPFFQKTTEIMEYNQLKMLSAFTQNKVSSSHLFGSTGYGYDDAGRERLEGVFATLTGSEAALYRHNFVSGTHAITTALFGILRPKDIMVCATGTPYDTLLPVINGENIGSLKDFGVLYKQAELVDNFPDEKQLFELCKTAKICYIQRSRGYSARKALSLSEIEKISQIAKSANKDIIVVVDNCYGEFTNKTEPTQQGADLIIGSLIKNPGGGIAPTGGYIAGKKELVRAAANRLTVPGIAGEVGCTLNVLREMYLGLYFAPYVTAEALKTSIYAACLYELLGYEVAPHYSEERNDIITSIVTNSEEKLTNIAKGIQQGSPIDSFVTPEAWEMPGYSDKIIMAAGAFTMGSSIELSCDGPMRAPYTAYLQGGLNFTASRAAILQGCSGTGLLTKGQVCCQQTCP